MSTALPLSDDVRVSGAGHASGGEMRVLIIAGHQADVDLLTGLLAEIPDHRFKVTAVLAYRQGLTEIATCTHDIGLVSYQLGDRCGIDLIGEAVLASSDMPLVLLTGRERRDLDIEAIDAGAADYLPMTDLSPPLLWRAIRYATNRKRAERKLRESKDKLVRHMLALREAKERAEAQTAEYVEMMVENLASAKDELEAAAIAARESEQRYRVLAENSPVGIWHISVDGYTLFLNRAACELFEIGHLDEVRGRTCDQYVVSEYRAAMRAAHESWSSGNASEVEVTAMGGRTGVVRHLQVSGAPLLSSSGIAQSVLATVIDITGRKEVEETIQYMAQHDALTGLPNRVLFQDRLKQALAYAARGGRSVAVLLLDLDHFKDINDTMGHTAGDLLLQQVAGRLMKCVRNTDTVGRLGGDEFAVVTTELRRVDDVNILARRILDSVAEPYDINGQSVHSTTSIGITLYPDDTGDAQQLMKYADMALFHAKGDGRSIFHYYNKAMEAEIHRRKVLENDMRLALIRQSFILHYQPQIHLPTGRIVGAEALVRWRHEERGLVSPAEFIPLAESTGLIVPLGEWVLRAACEQAVKWRDGGLGDIRMAVNLSAVQFRKSDLVGMVKQTLEETGLPPECLELELTESMVMEDTDKAIDIMRALSKMGVQMSIDDFGTGFSSLSYLKKFPVERLKIDQSFVRNINHDPDDAVIATTIIRLAHNLKLNVVAEGVEQKQQADYLLGEGCDDAQGYYFGRPMAAEDIQAWVKKFRGS
ncbi:MAG: EAL domain-containing protein [Alphaproteobacteria bacterium]